MTITYVNNLGLSEMATGDNSGTWGNVTNVNLELIGQALGHGTRAIANASEDFITMSDGTLDDDRALYLKLTGGGQACTVTLLPATMSKVWIMENGTAAALTFTQGSGANVTIPAGDTKVIACTGGAGTAQIVYDVFASLSVVDLKVQDDLTVTDDASIGGALTVTGIMKTDDTTDATSTTDGSLQTDGGLSVAKDAVLGNDVKLLSDSSVLSFGADSDATLTHTNDVGLTLNSTNKLMFNDASQFIQGASATVLDIAATDEIELTATLIDVVGNFTNSGTLVSTGKITADAGIDIDNFNIDGTTIALSSGNMTLDGAGEINIDSATGVIRLKDGGTQFGAFIESSNAFVVKSQISDGDLKLLGVDGGSEITALTLDMSAAGAATFNNNVTAFSDRRLKSDIQTIENGLEKVEQLRGVTYTRDDNLDGGQQLGVIAQEVEEVFPQVVLTADDERGTKSVDYGRLTGALIEAVKELSAKVKELEGRLDASS